MPCIFGMSGRRTAAGTARSGSGVTIFADVLTGRRRIDRVSPVLCAHERILLPIADGLAEKLYKKKNSLFLQKQYNDMFPLVSMIEDFSVRK